MVQSAVQNFESFDAFYPFYLGEHSNQICRRLHVVGTLATITVFAIAVLTRQWLLLVALPVVGYGFAWVGHYYFEHNRPATFEHPIYSFLADFVMVRDVLTGRIAW